MKIFKAHRLVVLVLILGAVGATVILQGAAPRILLAAPDPPALGGLPDALSFTYSIPYQRLFPAAYRVTPQNAGSSDTLTWTVASEGGWFAVAPLSGTTPASFWITPTAFSTSTATTYTGAVTVTVTDPPDTDGSPHRIDLTLRVVDLVFIYSPLVMRNYTPPPPSPLFPNDPHYTNQLQWALDQVDAPEAWGYSTGEDVLIAVLDTGTDLDHPDLADKVRTDIDWDFVNDDSSADDDEGHGTHVSGIAAAATDNGIGVAGLGWEATILPLKVMDANGDGDSELLAQAIIYAADQGADVINMSLGGAVACPTEVQSAADYAYAKGVVLVAASGNHGGSEGPNAEMFPANCEHVLGIAATNSSDSVASYSNYGNHVSVAAPGSTIYSTVMGGGYDYKNGTSMSTPYVAGLTALLRARFSSYTPDQIASAILDNAEDLGATGWDKYYGCGRINAFQALSKGARGSSPVCLEGVGRAKRGVMDIGETLPDAPFVPGEIIVALQPGASVEVVTLRHGASAEFLPALKAWRLRVPPGQERAILARLQADPAVAHADLNYLIFTQ